MSYTVTYNYGSQSEVKIYPSLPFVLETSLDICPWDISQYTDTSTSTYYQTGQVISSMSGTSLTLTAYAKTGFVNNNRMILYPDPSNTSQYIDIANTLISYTITSGKNNPYAYLTITVAKNDYNTALSTYSLTQKKSKITITTPTYSGSFIYERVTDNTSTYTITFVVSAYILKTTTLRELFNYTCVLSSAENPVPSQFIFKNLSTTACTISSSADSNGKWTITSPYIYGKRYIFKYNSVEDTLEYLSTTPEDLIQILARYTSTTVTAYNTYTYRPAISLKDTYTLSEIESIKATIAKDTSSSTNQYYTKSTPIIIRLDEYCADILEALCTPFHLSPVFEQTAMFTEYTSDTVLNIKLSWSEGDDATHTEGSTTYYMPRLLQLPTNEDQGSEYVLSSQKICAEAYERSASIIDPPTIAVGVDKKLMLANVATSSFTETIRKNIVANLALTYIVDLYKPNDCIQYTTDAKAYPTPTATITTLSSLPTPSSTYVNKIYKVADSDGFFEEYFKCVLINSVYIWQKINEVVVNNHSLNTHATTLVDEQNNITLTNAPIAEKIYSYPEEQFTYTWGNPQFMDEQNQLSSLTNVANDTTLDNTSDNAISSSDATMIVLGNQSLKNITSSRAGFTGIILEKVRDTNTYQIVGYNNGAQQVSFDNQGRIATANDKVILDADGISISGGLKIDLDNTSKIIANKVVLDSTGLHTYSTRSGDTFTGVQSAIESDGKIKVGGGAVVLDANGFTGYDCNSATNRRIVISPAGRIAIGGYTNGPTMSIADSYIRFYQQGAVINADGTITGTIGASVTSEGLFTGLADGSVSATTIVNNAISTAHLIDDAVIASKIKDLEISSSKLQDSAVITSKINDNAVTTTKIQDASITNAKIGQLAVGTANIQDGAITTAKIGTAQITTALIDRGAITSAKIGDAQITTALIANEAVTNAKIQNLDVSKLTTGVLTANVAIKLENSGAEILAGKASSGGNDYYAVHLNASGLQTYSDANTQQCSIGTDGAITAGSGYALLDNNGISLKIANTATSYNTKSGYKLVMAEDTSKVLLQMNAYIYDSGTSNIYYTDIRGISDSDLPSGVDKSILRLAKKPFANHTGADIKLGEETISINTQGDFNLSTYTGDINIVSTTGIICFGLGSFAPARIQIDNGEFDGTITSVPSTMQTSLKALNMMAETSSTDNYIVIGDIVVQWGVISNVSTMSHGSVTFTKEYANTSYSITLTLCGTTAGYDVVRVLAYDKDTDSFWWDTLSSGSVTGTYSIQWVAIGKKATS